MLMLTRHNERPFEMTAELISLLESLPEGVTFINVYGEVLVRAAAVSRQPKKHSGTRVRPGSAGRRGAAPGE